MSVPGDDQPGWMAWAPPLNPPDPAGMPLAVAQGIADEFWPDQPYLTAGLQWQWYALSLPVAPTVTTVSTGVQSVGYATGSSPFALAMERAQWYLDQGQGSLVSVPLSAGDDLYGWGPLRDMCWWIDP